jgi:SulP family sulfate permease
MTTDALVPGQKNEQAIEKWTMALLFGLLTGAITIIASVSLAALIFSGKLASHLAGGVDIALLSATLIGLVVSLAGSFRVAIAIPQDRTAPILAIMASGIVAAAPASASADQVFFNVVGAIVATTLITGAFLLALGYLRAGGLMRFIPYSVLGGFFAGTGWLLVLGGLRVMTGLELSSLTDTTQLLEANMLERWLPGLAISLAIFATSRFINPAIALPLLLIGGTGLFFVVMLSSGETLSTLGCESWLLGPWEHGSSDHVAGLISHSLGWGGWSLVPTQLSSIATVLVISAVSILLTVSAIEMLSGQDIDINRELRVVGVANLLTGLGGGMVGFHSLGISSLVIKLGARTRLTGVIAALTCGGALLYGADAIAYLPRIVPGGLLIFLGFAFLGHWLIGTWDKLPRGEYLLILFILLIVATVGFVEGVLAGLFAALLLFVLNYSRTEVVRYALSGAQAQSRVERNLDEQRFLRDHGEQLYLLKLRGYLFFGTATQLISRVRQRAEDSHMTPLRFVLIDFDEVSGIDSSATYAFKRMALMARQQQFVLLLTGLSSRLHKWLDMREVRDDDGHVRSFVDLDRGLDWYESQLLEKRGGGHSRVTNSIMRHVADRFGDAAKVQALLGYLSEISFPKGYELIKQGEKAGDLYFLEKGEVSVYLRTAEGRLIRIRRTGSGTVFGEMGFYLGTPRSASVVADCPGKAYRLTTAALETMEAEQPEIAAALHRFIADLLAERLLQATETLSAVIN